MALKECTKKEAANSYELVVSVDGETFEKAINKVYKKQVKSINVQGFRKGKAPRRIIEKMYGTEVFYDDAMQECYPDALYDAAKEADVKIVGVESLEAVEAGKDGFTFKAQIVVEPTMEIDGYKGLVIEKKSTEVTDELIEKEIEQVRERNSRIVTVEDGCIAGGFGSAVAEWLFDHGHSPLLRRLGLPDTFVEHGKVGELQHLVGIDSFTIKQTILDLCESSS